MANFEWALKKMRKGLVTTRRHWFYVPLRQPESIFIGRNYIDDSGSIETVDQESVVTDCSFYDQDLKETELDSDDILAEDWIIVP